MKIRNLLSLILALTALVSFADKKQADVITPEEQTYLDVLYAAMPLSDQTAFDQSYYLNNVRLAMKARSLHTWGKTIPENIFRFFVLPVRGNNENLDNFRALYFDEIQARVKGMNMMETALEVNHWCHEKVTYEPNDSRTSAPTATMRTSKGRCGEQSVFGVAALRAAGIPARQVYTPRWAHTDDNHAWVEVWIDGKWYFLGACEPEPVLNRAWFNAPVMRGMLMHTNVLGEYQGTEQIIAKKNGITEINVTDNYVPVRDNVVTVIDRFGKPMPFITVEFKIYNYAEFYTAARVKADTFGSARLKTGLGDILAWATDGEYFGFAKVSSENTALVLNHKVGEPFSEDITIVPPPEGQIPSDVTQAQLDENQRRFNIEDSIRGVYMATFATEASTANLDPRVAKLLINSRGNWRELDKFLKSVPKKRQEEAICLLENITQKDTRDTPADVLLDAIKNTTPQMKNELYVKYILSPRISNELLTPFKSALRKTYLGKFKKPAEIVEYVKNTIAIDNMCNVMRVPIWPANVDKVKKADSHSRDIYFVALCRALEMPARIDPVTGKTQYSENGNWIDAEFEKVDVVERPKGEIKATYKPNSDVANPQYYRHYTLSNMDNGSPKLLEFDEYNDYFENTLGKGETLDAGYYMLTTGSRLASGTVLAHVEFLNIKANETYNTSLVLREDTTQISIIGNMDPEMLYMPRGAKQEASILSTAGRGYFLLCCLGDTDEPTNHAVHDLKNMADELNAWGRPIVVLSQKDKPLLNDLKNLHYGTDVNDKVAKMLREGCKSERKDMPVIVLCDSFGRVVYYTEGYNTSLGANLKYVISRL